MRLRFLLPSLVLGLTASSCALARNVSGSPHDAGADVHVALDGEVDSGRNEEAGADGGGELDADVDAQTGWILDYLSATFSRPTEASFLTGPASATGAFIAWAPPNAPRFEDRGDGAGPLLLMEGERTNLLRRSRDLSSAAWSIPGSPGVIVTEDAAPGPDGTMTAHSLAGSGYSPGQPLLASPQLHVVSAWGRARTVSTTWTGSFAYLDQPNAPAWYVTDQSTTWTRRFDSVAPATSANYFPVDLGIGPGALDLILDLHQIEVGAFPSSVIRTEDSATTRAADVMSFPAAQVPPRLLTGRGELSQLSPEFASTDVVAGVHYWLLSIGTGSGVRIAADGSGTVVQAVVGGAVQAQSQPLVFTPHQLLGRVEWFPSEGRVTVGAIDGPVGSAWTWGAADVRIGGAFEGGGEAFARLGRLSGD